MKQFNWRMTKSRFAFNRDFTYNTSCRRVSLQVPFERLTDFEVIAAWLDGESGESPNVIKDEQKILNLLESI